MADDDPKLDYYPDGWGMKIDGADDISPEEALELAKAIEKQRKGENSDVEGGK
jgi:hypothetical protein